MASFNTVTVSGSAWIDETQGKVVEDIEKALGL